MNINNTSTGGSTFYWSFCSGNINTAPQSVDLGNPGGYLNAPTFCDFAKDTLTGNYYGFITNYSSGRLTRLFFGNSMLNTPTETDMGNFGGILISGATEGIQLVYNENKWYAFVMAGTGSGSKIVKLQFGNSLANTPTATDLGNIGHLVYPHDLYMFKNNGIWYGFIVNKNDNSLSLLNFTNSFNNTPTGSNLGNIGSLNYPTGICAVYDNGNWHVFITSSAEPPVGSPTSAGSLTRLDFGNSLLNTPVGVNLGTLGGTMNMPRDICLLKVCGDIEGFVVNELTKDVVRLDFNNNITSVPTATSMGIQANSNYPHSISKIFRVGSDLYTLVANIGLSTIIRMRFAGCTGITVPSSTDSIPPPITYTTPGTYNINLTMDDGLPTAASVCKTVVVVNLAKKPSQSISLCSPDSAILKTDFPTGSYTWNTGSLDSVIAKTTGTYWVDANYEGCHARDSIIIAAHPLPIVNLGNDTSYCSNNSHLLLNAGNTGATYTWQDGSTAQTFTVTTSGTYRVKVQDQYSCIGRDTVAINVLSIPVLSLPFKDTSICNGTIISIPASGTGTYAWSPATGLDNNTISNPHASPVTTTNYVVSLSGSNGCSAKDSVLVTAHPLPVVNLGNDSSYCANNNNLVLNAGNAGAAYTWQDGSTAQTFTVTTSGSYHVKVQDQYSCIGRDTVAINVLSVPVLSLPFKDTSICNGTIISIPASGTGTYAWSPATGLDNNTISNPQASPVTTTNYIVSLSGSNGCSVKDSVLVTPHTLPVVNLGNDSSYCANSNNLVLNAGNAGATYTWQDGSTAQTFAVTTTGTYYVKVQDQYSCIGRDTVAVNVWALPVLVLPFKDTSICNGTIISIPASGAGTYAWSPATGLDNSTVSNPQASPVTTTNYIVSLSNSNGCSVKDSVLVTEHTLPIVNLGNDSSYCANNNNLLLNAGNAGAAYTWQDGSTAQTFAVTTTGTYYVKVQDQYSCIGRDTVAINVWSVPVLVLPFKDTSICNGTIISIPASGAGTYAWSPATGLDNNTVSNPQASPVTTTNYIVSLSNSNGCSVKDSVLVTEHTLPIVNLGNDSSYCASNNKQVLDAGNAGATYTWQDGSTAQTFTVTTTGSYYVKVQDQHSCIGRDTVAINVWTVPVLVLPFKDTSVCNGTIISIPASGAGTYAWSPATGLDNSTISNPQASPLTTTNYIVSLSNSNGCSVKDSVLVTEHPSPIVNLGNDSSYCASNNKQVLDAGNAGATYTWQDGSAARTFTVITTGSYYVKVQDQYSCIGRDTVAINVLSVPVLVLPFADTLICKTTTISIPASGAGSYAWSPATGLSNSAVSNPQASPATTTNYTVTLTGNNGCESTGNVLINVHPYPVFGVTPASSEICAEDSVPIIASGSDTYRWIPAAAVTSPDSASVTAFPSVSTLFKIAVTDSVCKIKDTLFSSVTVHQKPVLNVNKSNDIDCFNGQSQLGIGIQNDPIASYVWSPATGLSSNAISNPIATPISSTTYSVEVTDIYGCKQEGSVNVKVITNETNGYFVPSAFTPNHDAVNDCFGIKNWGEISQFEFAVFNRFGQRVFFTTSPLDCWDGTFNREPQPAGTFVYYIRAVTLCGAVERKGTVVLIR